MSSQGLAARYAFYLASVFLAIGAHLPFWPLWLEARGLTAAEIGLLLALGSWVKVAANPGLAHLSDRAGWGKGSIVLLTVLTLLLFIGFVPAQGFAWILALHLVTAMTFPLLVPLAEAQTMAAVYRHGLDFGRVRLWGSLAFIVGSLATGRLIAAYDADWVLWLVLAALVPCVIAAIALPGRDPVSAADPAEDISLKRLARLLAQREVMVFLAAASLIQASHAAYYGFSSLAWRAAGIGETTIAVLWTEGVVAEILFFALSRRFARRLHPTTLLAAAAVVGTLRWVVTALTVDLVLLSLVQTLHAATFAATHLAAMHFITQATPPRLTASMQTLYAALSGGLVMGGAMLLAGTLYAYGPELPFFAMAGLTLAAAACALAGRPPAGPQAA